MRFAIQNGHVHDLNDLVGVNPENIGDYREVGFVDNDTGPRCFFANQLFLMVTADELREIADLMDNIK